MGTPVGNPFNELVSNLINMQLASMQTQETVSNSNKILTDANQALSEQWISCPESNPGDPGYAAYYYLQMLPMPSNTPPLHPNWPDTAHPKPTKAQIAAYFGDNKNVIENLPPPGLSSFTISDWVKTFLDTSNTHLRNLSSAFMTEVYSIYEQNPPPGTTNTALGFISSVTNLLQAHSQADLQTGQNGISLLNNLQQHFVSDQGPLSSATSTIIDGVNNFSTAMSQITA